MNVTVFIIVSWFLGLCGTFDVLRQPGDAFRAAEHSKNTWLMVEVAGTLLSFTGIFTWAAYTFWVRPSVVRAGGRRRVFIRTFFKSLNESAEKAAAAKPKEDLSLPPGPGGRGSTAWYAPGYYDTYQGRMWWDGHKWKKFG
jgi:hypothetical protein